MDSEEVARLKARVAELEEKLRLANQYHPNGRCRVCGGKVGDHWMRCAQYVGPVTHSLRYMGWNGTFGGDDYWCSCGSSIRIGGMAGADPLAPGEKPTCRNAAETWRGPRPAEAGEGD